jgi:hypothetical protein
LLATSAYMLGRDDGYIRTLERAHHAHLDAGDTPRAVRCAYWIGHNLMLRGNMGPATGWFGRGERLLEGHRPGSPCEGLTTPRDELGLVHASQSNREAMDDLVELPLFVPTIEPPGAFALTKRATASLGCGMSGAVDEQALRRRRRLSISSASCRRTRDVANVRECPPFPNVPVSYPRETWITPPQTTPQPYLQGFLGSPLTDSNRRPPPYPFERRRGAEERRLTPCFPCNSASSSARRTLPRRALSLPEKPRTCPQNLPPVALRARCDLRRDGPSKGGSGRLAPIPRFPG